MPPGGLADAQLKRKADTPADGDLNDRRVKRSAEPDSGDGEPMLLDCESVSLTWLALCILLFAVVIPSGNSLCYLFVLTLLIINIHYFSTR